VTAGQQFVELKVFSVTILNFCGPDALGTPVRQCLWWARARPADGVSRDRQELQLDLAGPSQVETGDTEDDSDNDRVHLPVLADMFSLPAGYGPGDGRNGVESLLGNIIFLPVFSSGSAGPPSLPSNRYRGVKRGPEHVDLHSHSPIRLHGVVRN
jgi:hypothetical protein